jgi:salicylate biosynthesis isochorismate synthase/menaquinone-specific isochorismate synthase
VTVATRPARGPFALDATTVGTLAERIREALRLARRDQRPAVASVCVPVAASVDLSAAVLAARRPDDRFFCLEQPGHDAHTICSLGTAVEVSARGPARFAEVAAACREHGRRTFTGDPATDAGRPPGAGPVYVGGFAFAPEGGQSPEWAGFPAAQLVLPELSLARLGDDARLTITVAADGDVSEEALLERALRRVGELRPVPMPLLDPHPLRRPQVAGAAPPSHFEQAVQAAVERIRAGSLDKLVLAREVRVHAGAAIDPAPVFDALRAAFSECYCYCVGGPDAAFVGASPELLVRREGERAQTVALAGTTRRSADPAVDSHLGEQLLQSPKNRAEQAIVARRIQRALDPMSVWVAAADEPVLVKVQNVQHLATPIRAQLAEPISAVELAGRLHPTPAVGGEPGAVAEPLIPALEGLDRGWYAGAIGWTDASEDGEFCVALRCALLRGSIAHLYAGCGIVADSVPSDELEESEVKLEALLPLLI